MTMPLSTPRELAEQRARQAHAERCARLEGHKIAPWEGLSEMMREALIVAELNKLSNTNT